MQNITTKARVLAYYLPQFHPIPENDMWWGKGFTEWTNVGKARSLFPGHYQPHVPADLGYYDLRVPETREAQASMARKYGIEGFVYWHYWFGNGKRLLERPFNEVLKSGKPEFPFALAWANETWAGFSFGANNIRNPLIEQTYPGTDDYIRHFYEVLPAFKDSRYITCEGKPIFIIYKPNALPNARNFINLWNSLAIENGLKGIFFIAHTQNKYKDNDILECKKVRIDEGYDAITPVNYVCNKTRELPFGIHLMRLLLHKYIQLIPDIRPYDIKLFKTSFDGDYDVFPTVFPNWDHTPRTGRKGTVLYNSTPEKFENAMRYAVSSIRYKPKERQFIFIKSWNEWAEGNYLEPDLKWGTRYLEAVRNVVLQ